MSRRWSFSFSNIPTKENCRHFMLWCSFSAVGDSNWMEVESELEKEGELILGGEGGAGGWGISG